MTPLDPRLNAVRPDLADERLRGRVEAVRFVAGRPGRVIAASAPLRREPRPDAGLDTEALHGETLRVFDDPGEGWAWVQLDADGYVGWMPMVGIGPVEPAPTHRVTALRSLLFPGPDLKLPPLAALPFASRVAVLGETTVRGTAYALLAGGGALAACHLAPLDAPPAPDPVAVAERFLGIPYLWGGRTSLGLDCSGLVQTALTAAGMPCPRDTDMQRCAFGPPIAAGDVPRRGDLAFWPGHVGVFRGEGHLLHANAFHMTAASEPLAETVARIGPPEAILRPFPGRA